MQPDSLSKVLSQVLLPYGQQWAVRSGYPLISKLLADEQLHDLIGRYGDSMLAAWTEERATATKPNAGHNGNGQRTDASFDGVELQQLNARLTTVEAQHQQLRTLLDTVRTKMRPLAQALGCCPECLVGVEGCPRCWGKSIVGGSPPDLVLLQSLIVDPLAASGVPLRLTEIMRRLRVADARSQLQRETGANHE